MCQKIWAGVSPSFPISKLTQYIHYTVCEKWTKNLGMALPPLIWTKSKRTATFFVKPSLTAVFVKKNGRHAKKSSPTPQLGHPLPVTALALSAHGLEIGRYIQAIEFIDLLFVETSETKRKGRLKLQKTEGWEFLFHEVDQKMKKAPLCICRDAE